VKTSMPRIHGHQRVLAAHDVQRCAALGAGFSEHERAVGEIEGARLLRPPSFAPAGRQCSRPAIIRWITSHRSPSRPIAMRLRCAAVPARSALDGSNRRIGRTQHEDARKTHVLERLTDDARLQRAQVGVTSGSSGISVGEVYRHVQESSIGRGPA